MKRIWMVFLLVACLLLLTACGEGIKPINPYDGRFQTVETVDLWNSVYIIADTSTGVLYWKRGRSISPLLNADGTPMFSCF